MVGQNQDGRLEIFAPGTDGAIWHKWQLTPNGDWSGWSSLGNPRGVSLGTIAVAQNQDGRLAVFAEGDGAVWHVFQLTPNGGWGGWTSLGGEDLKYPVVGRNQDGRLEIFAWGGNLAIWHKAQLPTSIASPSFPIHTSFDKGDRLAAGDINGDGQSEVLVAEDDGGDIIYYSVYGEVLYWITTSYDHGGDDIALGDIDGDHHLEILVAEDDGGGIDFYAVDGIRRWSSAPGLECASTFDGGGDGLAAADFDGDGTAEIAVAEDDGGNIRILNPVIRDNTEVCLEYQGSLNTYYDGGDSLAAGDINGDGLSELLVAEDDGGPVDIYRPDGTHLWWFVTKYDGGDDTAVADINCDGKLEFLVAEDDGGTVESFRP